MRNMYSVVAVAALLAACGGGGGDNSPNPVPRDLTARTVTNLQVSTDSITALGLVPSNMVSAKGGSATYAPMDHAEGHTGEVYVVDGSGTAQPVFEDYQANAYGFEARSNAGRTIMVFNGNYENMMDSQGNAFTCNTVTVSQDTTQEEVTCVLTAAAIEGVYNAVIPSSISVLEDGSTRIVMAANRIGGGTDLLMWDEGDVAIQTFVTHATGQAEDIYSGSNVVALFGNDAGAGRLSFGQYGSQNIWHVFDGGFPAELPISVGPVASLIFPEHYNDLGERESLLIPSMDAGDSYATYSPEGSSQCSPPSTNADIIQGSVAGYWISSDRFMLCKVYLPNATGQFFPNGLPNDQWHFATTHDAGLDPAWKLIAASRARGLAYAELLDGSKLLYRLFPDVRGTVCGGAHCDLGEDAQADYTNWMPSIGLISITSFKYYTDGIAIVGTGTDENPRTVYWNTTTESDTFDSFEPGSEPVLFDSFSEVQ